MTTPFRLKIEGRVFPTLEVLKENAAANDHWPRLTQQPPNGRKLAIVGGSPYVRDHLEELRAWDGDVWGINATAQWLNENGVKAKLFTIDGQFIPSTVQDRILASCCPPAMFVGNCTVFDAIETHPETGHSGGQSSVSRAPKVAMLCGYIDVSFFGCEGCFEGADHVDRDEADPCQLIVRVGGKDYITRMDFLIYTEELAELIRNFSIVFTNRSGGLLKAMLENWDTWEIVGVSAALKEHLEEINGKQGMYDQPYVPAV